MYRNLTRTGSSSVRKGSTGGLLGNFARKSSVVLRSPRGQVPGQGQGQGQRVGGGQESSSIRRAAGGGGAGEQEEETT